MSDDLVKQAIIELQDLVLCRCHPAYKDRNLHDPACHCDDADNVALVADHIEELHAEKVDLHADNLRLRLEVANANDTADAAIEEVRRLEARIKEDALQYLSDTGQMGDTIDDLTRRHTHALHKIDVLEEQLAKTIHALQLTEQWFQELGMYTNPEDTLAPALQVVRTTLEELKGDNNG
jgi:predicted RNase H-like nuclease (RuvC/YqgF family)